MALEALIVEEGVCPETEFPDTASRVTWLKPEDANPDFWGLDDGAEACDRMEAVASCPEAFVDREACTESVTATKYVVIWVAMVLVVVYVLAWRTGQLGTEGGQAVMTSISVT